jgi:hypothetical protein
VPDPELTLLRALFEGDADGAAAAFAADPVLDAPLAERAVGFAALDRLVRRWPRLFGGGAPQAIEPRHRTAAGARTVCEAIVALDRVHLPIAVVGERTGDVLREARVYHFRKPFPHVGERRRPAFEVGDRAEPGRAEELPDVNARYFRAYAEGDLDGLMALFAEEAYLQAGLIRLTSRTDLRAFFARGIGRGLSMRFDAATDDGTTFVLEFTRLREPVSGGLAAYERTGDGRLAAIRIYDDGDPEVMLGPRPEAAIS